MNWKRSATIWAFVTCQMLSVTPHFDSNLSAPGVAVAAAGGFQKAHQAFTEGDTATATKILEPLLSSRGRSSPAEIEGARILLGVCYYLDGKKRNAEKVFQQALAVNPRAQLRSEYLLDPEVAKLFESVRARNSGNQQNRASRGLSGTQPRGTLPPTGASKKPVTGLFVQCNIASARVFLNDIYAGNANELLPIDPGKYRVVVSYEGYLDAATTVALSTGRTQKLKVELRKPAPPKPPPRPVVQATQKNRVQQANQDESGVPRVRQLPREEFPKTLPQGKSSLADEFFREQAPPPPPPPPPTPRPVVVQPLQPIYQTPQPVYQPPQPVYQPPQPVYQPPQPVYQPPQPVYQPPQPVYQQPQPVYQQPQPVYQQPQPVYQQPQPVYQQPQPVYQQPQPVYQEPQPVYQQPTTRTRTKTTTRARTAPRSMFVAILPLGAGQFQNRDYLLGGGFATLQVGGLGGAYYFYKKEKDFMTAEAAAQATADTGDDYDPQQSKSYKEAQRRNQYIAAGVAALSWGIGIFEAIVKIDKPLPKTADVNPEELEEQTPATPPPTRYTLGIIPMDLEGIGVNFSVRF